MQGRTRQSLHYIPGKGVKSGIVARFRLYQPWTTIYSAYHLLSCWNPLTVMHEHNLLNE